MNAAERQRKGAEQKAKAQARKKREEAIAREKYLNDPAKRENKIWRAKDIYHKRLALLRELFFKPSAEIKKICLQYGISPTSYYRLVEEYRIFGPWAVIPANLPEKEAMNSGTELNIILEKLRYPRCSASDEKSIPLLFYWQQIK